MAGMTDYPIFQQIHGSRITSAISVGTYSICRQYGCAIQMVKMIGVLSAIAAIFTVLNERGLGHE